MGETEAKDKVKNHGVCSRTPHTRICTVTMHTPTSRARFPQALQTLSTVATHSNRAPLQLLPPQAPLNPIAPTHQLQSLDIELLKLGHKKFQCHKPQKPVSS
ncbi:hypothetical protein TRVL_07753 [Trypanosoma vivax]|nr:hypothetical protein TRVL_07753 [Trypanosoma vivax]